MYSMIGSSIVLAVFSVLYCWRRYNPRYLRSFPVFTLVNMSENLLAWFVRTLIAPAENIYTLFEMVYFCYFLGTMMASKRSRYIMGVFAVVYTGGYLFFLIRGNVLRATGFLVIVEAFLLCIGCLLYFRELMLDPAGVDLSRNPGFWMTTGTIFYFAISIPAIFLDVWYSYKGHRDYGTAIWSINNYAQVISAALYIKGMTCLKKPSS